MMKSLKDGGLGGARNDMRSRILKSFRLKQKEDCPICLGEFLPNDSITILACNERHFMHTDCAKEWMKSNKNNSNCLLCRKPIEVSKIKKMIYRGLEDEHSEAPLELTDIEQKAIALAEV